MDVRQFIQTYREDWQKLENFIITINKNKREKTSEDIHEFHRTYIKVTQAFSYSQTYFPEEEVTAYLNELVAKAHNLLYQDKVSSRSQFKHFFTQTFIKLLFEQRSRSEEHTSELQSRGHLVCRLLLEKKKKNKNKLRINT